MILREHTVLAIVDMPFISSGEDEVHALICPYVFYRYQIPVRRGTGQTD